MKPHTHTHNVGLHTHVRVYTFTDVSLYRSVYTLGSDYNLSTTRAIALLHWHSADCVISDALRTMFRKPLFTTVEVTGKNWLVDWLRQRCCRSQLHTNCFADWFYGHCLICANKQVVLRTKIVCLLLNGTSPLFRLLVPRIVKIHTRHIKTIWN